MQLDWPVDYHRFQWIEGREEDRCHADKFLATYSAFFSGLFLPAAEDGACMSVPGWQDIFSVSEWKYPWLLPVYDNLPFARDNVQAESIAAR